MSTIPDCTDDVIDSRDVIARIEELESERDDHEHDDDGNRTGLSWAEDFPEEADELRGLLELAEEAESSPDWHHGEMLIAEGYFTTYIEELIDDCYELPEGMKSGDWPWRHMSIDYEAAANEAKADYNEVSFRGHTFLIRA